MNVRPTLRGLVVCSKQEHAAEVFGWLRVADRGLRWLRFCSQRARRSSTYLRLPNWRARAVALRAQKRAFENSIKCGTLEFSESFPRTRAEGWGLTVVFLASILGAGAFFGKEFATAVAHRPSELRLAPDAEGELEKRIGLGVLMGFVASVCLVSGWAALPMLTRMAPVQADFSASGVRMTMPDGDRQFWKWIEASFVGPAPLDSNCIRISREDGAEVRLFYGSDRIRVLAEILTVQLRAEHDNVGSWRVRKSDKYLEARRYAAAVAVLGVAIAALPRAFQVDGYEWIGVTMAIAPFALFWGMAQGWLRLLTRRSEPKTTGRKRRLGVQSSGARKRFIAMLRANETETRDLTGHLAEHLSEFEATEIKSLVEHGEPGVALEMLCDCLVERDIIIPQALAERMRRLGARMGIDLERVDHIRVAK